jgi:transcription initiation factor TFIIIB Brf1 subunit/transcription initiation factor TFIIB
MSERKHAQARAETIHRREQRLGSMRAYLELTCQQMGIDAKYITKARELLPKAAVIGLHSSRGPTDMPFCGPIEAIVDALIYAVIIDESGVECSLVARELHRHRKQHAFKLVREVRRITGLGGKVYPVLRRAAIEQLALVPDEVDDIKAIIDDPHFQGWVGPSPASIGAAITYLYLLRCRPIKATQYKVGKAFGITEVCLRQRVKNIKDEVTCNE